VVEQDLQGGVGDYRDPNDAVFGKKSVRGREKKKRQQGGAGTTKSFPAIPRTTAKEQVATPERKFQS